MSAFVRYLYKPMHESEQNGISDEVTKKIDFDNFQAKKKQELKRTPATLLLQCT